MEIPIQNVYYLLAYAWDQLDEADALDLKPEEFKSIFELLAKVLVNGTSHLVKKGLQRNYIPEIELGSRFRGKILFQPSVTQQTLLRAAAYFEYDDLSFNVLPNQIIKATMKRLISEPSLETSIKQELRLVLGRLPVEIKALNITKNTFKQIYISKNNRNYKLVLSVCRLIWNELLVSEEEGRTPFKDFLREKRRMAHLFERFLLNFYKRHLNRSIWKDIGRTEISWKLLPTNSETQAKFIPRMITDVTFVSKDRYIILDAKYYPKAMQSQFGSPKLISGNLYQMFAYCQNLRLNREYKIEGILLYPTVTNSISLQYKYNSDGNYYNGNYCIRIETINLNQDWRLIEADLLEIVEQRES